MLYSLLPSRNAEKTALDNMVDLVKNILYTLINGIKNLESFSKLEYLVLWWDG